jgi:transcriptional regulator of heat shock response
MPPAAALLSLLDYFKFIKFDKIMTDMNTAQLEKELLHYTKDLPKEALEEVIDFVRFLRQKISGKSLQYINDETSTLNTSQNTHLEEEFENYQKQFPRE